MAPLGVGAKSSGKFLFWGFIGAGLQFLLENFTALKLPDWVGLIIGAAGKGLASWIATRIKENEP